MDTGNKKLDYILRRSGIETPEDLEDILEKSSDPIVAILKHPRIDEEMLPYLDTWLPKGLNGYH